MLVFNVTIFFTLVQSLFKNIGVGQGPTKYFKLINQNLYNTHEQRLYCPLYLPFSKTPEPIHHLTISRHLHISQKDFTTCVVSDAITHTQRHPACPYKIDIVIFIALSRLPCVIPPECPSVFKIIQPSLSYTFLPLVLVLGRAEGLRGLHLRSFDVDVYRP